MGLRIYNIIMLAVIVLGAVVYLCGQLVLINASETLSFAQILERQRATDGLYFGLAEAPGNYKLAAYAARKPDVVILGSSRSHHQRQEFYTLPSYTMSGIVYSPADAIETLDLLIPVHKPKYVIYNLDFFAFCTRDPKVAEQKTFSRPAGKPQFGWAWESSNRFRLVPDLMMQGRLSWKDALTLGTGQFNDHPPGTSLFGINALLGRRGFRLDGSLTTVDAHAQKPEDMAGAKQEVIKGYWHYPSGCFYDRGAMEHLKIFRKEMAAKGIRLIVLVPPISPSMYKLFMAAREDVVGYYRAWLKDVKKEDFTDLYVMTDGATIGARETEFEDAVHGGDVSEARMVLWAAKQPNSALAPIINRDFLEQFTRERAGDLLVEMRYFQTHSHVPGAQKQAEPR